MKNYYELLEVDKNASDEIIKVAYKSLVKKYHPDLKSGEEKKLAEQKIKEINEAYDILSDPYQRHEYDSTLIDDKVTIEEYNYVVNENFKLTQRLNRFEEWYAQQNGINPQKTYNQQYTRQNYYNSNVKDTQRMKYNNSKKIGFLSNLSEGLKTAIAVMLTFIIIFLIIKIPFINSLLSDFLGNGILPIFVIALVGYIMFFKGKK